jgi:intergrase/recombinase
LQKKRKTTKSNRPVPIQVWPASQSSQESHAYLATPTKTHASPPQIGKRQYQSKYQKHYRIFVKIKTANGVASNAPLTIKFLFKPSASL